MERVEKGYVTDYLSFSVKNEKLRKIVFNLSDFSVFAGVFCCAVDDFFGDFPMSGRGIENGRAKV